MQAKNGSPCDDLLDCLTGGASPEQRRAFEAHLCVCPTCAAQWSELREVWDALQAGMEEIEPPAGLKEDVMRAVFGDAETTWRQVSQYGSSDGAASGTVSISLPNDPSGGGRRLKKRWLYGFGAAAAAIVVAAAIFASPLRPDTTSSLNVPDQPSAIEQTYVLRSFDQSMANASGTGWLLRQGDRVKLVLNLNGLSLTRNEEVYQVWLIRDGKRRNAGTFQVDAQGCGVLIYEMTKDEPFDAIGITLEPDSRGTQPRGKKVLGT